MRNYSALLLASSAMVLIGFNGVAFAQAALQQGGIETVTVTAQRRSEDLQKTPIAVTALSPEQLTGRNVQTTQDLMQVTPGLQVATQTAADSGGSATFFLRGMGQQRAGNGSDPAVGIYIDDFYYPSLEGSVFDILDLSQVEVLRGPQGTLFGRNTIGGAILYTTRKPDFDFGGDVQATAGSYDRWDITGAVNVPLTDDLAVRVTAGTLNRDGYVHEQNGTADAGGTRTNLVRGQLRYVPTDDLTIDLSVQYNKSYLSGYPYVMPNIAPVPGSLSFAWNHIPPLGGANPYDNRYASACDWCQAGPRKREYSSNEFFMASAVVQWDVSSNLTLKSMTGLQLLHTNGYTDLDGTVLPITEFNNLVLMTRAASQEFQLNGNEFDKRLNYVAGVYIFDQEKRNPPQAKGAMILGNLVPTVGELDHVATYAGYLDATYALTDMISLLAGGRYSQDAKSIDMISLVPPVTGKENRTFANWTWRVGAKAQWTDTLMSYATVSTGFRAGGFSTATDALGNPIIVPFKPEHATSYEVGSRLDLFDNRLRLNPTLFYVEWSDIQVQSVVPTASGAFIVLQNAARAHSQGAELEADAVVTDALSLFGNMSYLDIHYDSIGAATGITLHSRFERAPKFTYAFGGQYDTQVFDGYKLRANLNWSWEDTQYSTPTDSDTLRLPSYGLLNARVDFVTPDGRWDLGLFGTNLLDKAYYVGGVNYAVNAGAAHYDLGQPEEFGASLKYNF